MKYLLITALICTFSCTHIADTTPEDLVASETNIDAEIDHLLTQDRVNKELELEYLEQIRIAQENNDQEAFEFYFQEYVKVERLEIPEELKKHPNYFKGGLKVKY